MSPVAPRYIIGTISFYQTAIADILYQQMPDPALACDCPSAESSRSLGRLERPGAQGGMTTRITEIDQQPQHQCGQRAGLVSTHEAAITNHVSGKNGS